MVQYTDGTEAKVGDTVRGQCYNEMVRDEVTGIVAEISQKSTNTIAVACITWEEIPDQVPWDELHRFGGGSQAVLFYGRKAIKIVIFYGNARNFRKFV